MSRALVTIRSQTDRARIAAWADKAPPGTRVEFKGPQRSVEQNDKMWAMLTDVARQVTWHGLKLSTYDWKSMFMDALNREARMVPNIDNSGFVNLGRSTSRLSKTEFSDLIEIINAFGAEHGVVFSDPAETAEPGRTAREAA